MTRHTDTALIILSYLARHPEARDTSRGIADWWLLEGKAEISVEEVEDTLSKLATDGYLLTRQSAHSSLRYGINPAMLEEIQRLLKDPTCANT